MEEDFVLRRIVVVREVVVEEDDVLCGEVGG